METAIKKTLDIVDGFYEGKKVKITDLAKLKRFFRSPVTKLELPEDL